MESDLSPQLKGVVIISLPPPENPSLGKTITAFTFSDSPQPHHQNSQEQPHHNHQINLPIQSPQNPRLQFSFSRFRLFPGIPRKLLVFLGISLFAFVLYAFVFPKAIEEFRRSNDDEEGTNSFILPLYPKLGNRGQNDAELKLGRFVDFDEKDLVVPIGDGIRTQKMNKLVSSRYSVDSSTIFPVRGNVYPDGYDSSYTCAVSNLSFFFLSDIRKSKY